MQELRFFPIFFFICSTSLLSAQTIVQVGLGQMSVSQPTRNTATLTGQLLQNGGENPTIKIVWGDEDRGTSPTPSVAWDNEVIISTNQAPGSFSTTINIPNLDKIYYFRALASNAGGTVVSRELGILNPSAPVGKADLQGRWNFDASNANDVSGKNRHGSAKKLFSPSEISNIELWLDASDSSTITQASNAVSQWDDKSGNNYHATQSTQSAKPMTGTKQINGMNTIALGSGKVISSSSPSSANWQDLYIVARWDGGSTFNSYDGLFTGTANVNGDIGIIGHSGSSNLFSTNWFNNFYLNGSSSAITGVLDTMSSKFIVSVSANSAISVSGYQIGSDRTNGGRNWNGVVGEVLSYSSKLSDSDRQKVEGYLAHKWGLNGSLPSSHDYSLGHPVTASGSPSYISDTPFGSGKAVALSDGHIEVITGGNEDSFDGGSALSVSAWVKGWPKQFGQPIISKGASVPSPNDVPSLRLWLDASDTSTMDKGTSAGAIGSPSSGDLVKYWADKSGNGIVFTSTGSPKFEGSALNSDYPGVNTDLGNFTTSGGQIIDGWNSMTVFMVFDWLDTSNWEKLLWKGSPNGGHGFSIQKMNVGANQGTGSWFPRHADNGGGQDRVMSSKTDARSSTKILTLTYDGASKTVKLYGNGVSASTKTNAKNDLGSSTGSGINLGNDQRYGDILIYRNSLSNADRE